MIKPEIIALFDGLAPCWDDNHHLSDMAINNVLDKARLRKGNRILEVGCGTGSLIPYYLEREITDITAMDFSPEMVAIAQQKFADDPRVNILCGDIMETHFSKKFDSIILHDTLPFLAPQEISIKHLCHQLSPFGTLCIFHGLSRKEWNKAYPDYQLLSEIDLASMMGNFCKITTAISDQEKYLVVGIKK